MTLTADAYNARELAAKRLTPQHISALVAYWQEGHGLAVDGMCGPATISSVVIESSTTPATIMGRSEPDDQAGWNPGEPWPRFDGPLAYIPRSRQEIYEIFGNPGTPASPDKSWRKANLLEVRDLPGVPPRWFVQVHKLAEPYLREGLRRARLASEYQIDRLGCFVLRHIRHDNSRPLSLHSFGIAVDFDASANAAKGFERERCPVPFGPEWRKLWPNGVDRPFVEAMESVGWTWGGVWGVSGDDFTERAKACSFCDVMHFELRARG